MKSRVLIISVLLLFLTMLAGCWNYNDIENLAIVAGAAIDKEQKTGDYTLTLEIINPPSGAGEAKKDSQTGHLLIESKGRTILDAARNSITKVGKGLFWGHCKIVIVSENVAKEGIIPVMDFLMRSTKIRPDIWTLVSTAETAKEILQVSTEANGIISFYLNDTLKAEQDISKYVALESVDLVKGMVVKTTSVLVPMVGKTTDNDQTPLEISGTAIFKQDKLKSFLNRNESKIALLLRDHLKGGLVTLTENDPKCGTEITLEIFKSTTKLNPVVENSQIVMQIKSELDVGIAEIDGSTDFINKDKRKILQKDIEMAMAKQITSLVTKTKNNYATDIFDFNGAIQRKMPSYWKQIKPNWDKVYQNLIIRPDVKINISSSSTSYKPITIGD